MRKTEIDCLILLWPRTFSEHRHLHLHRCVHNLAAIFWRRRPSRWHGRPARCTRHDRAGLVCGWLCAGGAAWVDGKLELIF